MNIIATRSQSVRPKSPAGPAGWRTELREAIRDPAELCRLLALPTYFGGVGRLASGNFPLLVPRAYFTRIRPGDPADPLLRQILPLAAEDAAAPGYTTDPVGEEAVVRAPGLLHKYPGRALLVTTGACAVHCRYCFRRHFPYSDAPKSLAAWEPALEEIAADASLREILLSGGDPLTMVDDFLAELAARLASIAHIRRLRIHTRLPIVIPSRVCDDLLAWLTGTRLTSIVVVHANHPAELDPATRSARPFG